MTTARKDTLRHCEAGTMNVLILISIPLYAEALCRSLASEGNGFESRCTAQTQCFQPDVILADYYCLQDNTLRSRPDGKILLIDTGLSEEDILTLMRCHKLYGVFSPESGLDQLKKAISVIHRGQIWLDNQRLKVLLHGVDADKPAMVSESLSNKEHQIVELVAEGYKNREIASRLLLSEQTIKSHLGRIFRKMNVKNRSQLISLTIRNRLSLNNHSHREVI